jgi:hypothetical protein
MAGLDYPWAPVVDHAAEALVVLRDREAVPLLAQALATGAATPEKPISGSSAVDEVRELVRINHLRNCFLCHAASTGRADGFRAKVPMPHQLIPPATTPRYYDRGEREGDMFVDADVIYLKQDFSALQPVHEPGPLPPMQRYDYLVRTRPAGVGDSYHTARLAKHREEAIRYALSELDDEWRQRLALSKSATTREDARRAR